MLDWLKFEKAARDAVGLPYKFGSKWPLGDPDPKGPVDCSGFTRWLYSTIGVYLPVGSTAQMLSSQQYGSPGTGHIGFWVKDKVMAHHAGTLISDTEVAEARGCDKHEGPSAQNCPYNCVVIRPRAKWEAWKEFSGWMLPDAVIEKINGKLA